MALLLVVGTMGMTVNKHYCMGELKDVSINQEVNTCASEMKFAPEGFAMDCCDETSDEYQVDDFQKITQKIDFTADLYELKVISHLILDLQLVESNLQNPIYPDHSPPPIDRDIPVMVQSFLL